MGRVALLLLLLVCVVGVEAGGGFNYSDGLDKALLFLEAQRSGKLPPDQRVNWRSHSGLKDGFSEGVNLVGGYYDAGDHVKFGLPMAFAVTMLSWGAVDFRKETVHLNQMSNTLAAIKWATDYFIKAHTQPNLLWAQVGDGESDHYCWERAEDMTTPRTAYKLDPKNPGSDLAAETAAAMAAASLAFQPYDSAYSYLLLVHAKQLFSFADRFRGLYDDAIPSATQFYTSSGYSDELLWAAAWLYRATKDDYYLKYVVENGGSLGGTGWAVREFSWDNKYAGVQVLLSKISLHMQQQLELHSEETATVLKQYQAKADYFTCACLQKNGNDNNNVDLTPAGLIYVREWNNMQYVSSAAFLLAVYSQYLSEAKAVVKCPQAPQLYPQHILNFAKSQADYILGNNPKSISYLVGYGDHYPAHVHHRGASISPITVLRSTVGCVEGFEKWYRRPQPNPNVIYGALVGGPTNQDDFTDDRSNYEQTEPTLSAAAPLIGLFSKLHYSYSLSAPAPAPAPAPPAPYHPTPSPNPPVQASDTKDVVKLMHSIASTWTVGKETYYKHKVVIKNVSFKPITDLKLRIENLSGSIWGLSPCQHLNNTYQLPQWLKTLKPASELTFFYIQGGAQAKISVLSYHI
ncbi:PREDICTED: endoglucanase 5 [Ipomoea nil]|uniref:endoglucanase 5 n=1 Tax=Ipomoea nil TaxID=35883 RepID=UPI000901FA3C|nr:PREDICTED: endoglucanase 5 [Ipomoea nil]